MIYVILSAGFSIDSDNEFIKLLKIGYTKDSVSKDRRIYQYISHNPTVKVLYEIPDCTEEIEDLLHSYFSKYRYSGYGKEWFLWDEEIIKFFDTYKTIEDLLKILDFDMKERTSGCYKFNGYNKYVYEVIDHCLNYKMNLDKDYDIDQAMKDREDCFKEIDSSNIILKSGVLKLILKYFDIEQIDYEKYTSRDLPEDIKSFLSNFNTLSGFHDKMRAICESPFTDNEKFIILEQVPILYKNMYLQFGPSRLRAKSYNITNLRKELEPKVEEDITRKVEYIKAKNIILETFIIGKRYSLINIKLLLRDIYNSVGYNATPKASDLINYFNIKKIQIIDEHGKRSPGYEILKIKE